MRKNGKRVWAENNEGIKKERKEIKRIVLKEGGRKEKNLNFNRLLSIEIPPEVKISKENNFPPIPIKIRFLRLKKIRFDLSDGIPVEKPH